MTNILKNIISKYLTVTRGNPDISKTREIFPPPHLTKGKHYPLPIILDALAIYHLGYSLEQTCKIVNRRAANNSVILSPSTLANWLTEFADLCRFNRMREFALKRYSPRDMVITATLVHRPIVPSYKFI